MSLNDRIIDDSLKSISNIRKWSLSVTNVIETARLCLNESDGPLVTIEPLPLYLP
jgi:hypothetical protein